ncbi:malonate transporter MadL subunit [Neobacillus bataviensis]|uniref:Malonate transporter MadL subunit n=1 Tax=Neobacillus bataviensis TaxID=220685 RepID=A0A561D2D9_9BACI|nr:malonate transporter subunit MadL [Neobacillus bataviensis]TWD97615.1 malonate transporter MadL subunit [Neobacillus bataviensis]
MVIYGVALLSFAYLAGQVLGDLLGKLIGVKANVGGVGISIFLLLLLIEYLTKKGKLNIQSQDGLKFWGAMYIPIVVAMAAQQNVMAAVKGGPLALLAGVITVIIMFLLIPLLDKVGKKEDSHDLEEELIEPNLELKAK